MCVSACACMRAEWVCTCVCARVCVGVSACVTLQEQKISLTKFTDLHSIMFLAKQVDLLAIGRPAHRT